MDAYNASLPAIVAAQKAAGKRITLVDMHAAITTDDLLPDGVHPNQAGMDKMAATWFAALSGITEASPRDPFPATHSTTIAGEKDASHQGEKGASHQIWESWEIANAAGCPFLVAVAFRVPLCVSSFVCPCVSTSSA